MGKFIPQDTFFKKAKKDGYRARSAYKLKEIQERFHILKKGDNVLDLGCAPGSFLQVIAQIVGDKGTIAGIDLLPVASLPAKNIIVLKGDIRKIDIGGVLEEIGLPFFDAITCDISPNLTGIREVDDRNMEELYQVIRKIVAVGLRRGGCFIIKLFFSEQLKGMTNDLKDIFAKVIVFKPTASRSMSSEIYLICKNKG